MEKTYLLSIVGTQSAYVNSKKVLCIFDKDINGANTVLERAIQKKRFKNMVEDSSKISSYIITENGMIYSSSVSIRTLVDRLNKQDIYSCPLISGQAYIICDKIESVFELKTNEQIDNTRYIPVYYGDNKAEQSSIIRTIVRTERGTEFPSTFSGKTLKQRIEKSF